MRALTRRLRDRVEAIRDSLTLDYDGLAGQQFVRFLMYQDLRARLAGLSRRRVDVLEIGRSNGTIASFLSPGTHTVTGDYPATDVCAMPEYGDETYDVVILDQVLEHVSAPDRAIAEAHRVLRRGGCCVVTTPFLIQIHAYPCDYWRFTSEGLRTLLARFSESYVGQWGNRFTVETTLDHGWISAWESRRRFRVLLRNEMEWPISLWAVATK